METNQNLKYRLLSVSGTGFYMRFKIEL